MLLGMQTITINLLILKHSGLWIFLEDVSISWRIRIKFMYSAGCVHHFEETHINYITGSTSVPIIPLLLADVVCEPARSYFGHNSYDMAMSKPWHPDGALK